MDRIAIVIPDKEKLDFIISCKSRKINMSDLLRKMINKYNQNPEKFNNFLNEKY